jgi:uncharacterized membrane protein YgcG
MSNERLEHFFRRRAIGGAGLSSLRPFSKPFLGQPTSTSLSSEQAITGLLDATLDEQLKSILFACGDVLTPSTETVEVLKEIISQHLGVLTHFTLDAAAVHNQGHVIDERHVVAALRDHGHIDAAERVLYLAQRRKAIESLLRVDLGKDEEGSIYSKKDLPPEVLTTSEVENARKEGSIRQSMEEKILIKMKDENNTTSGSGSGGGGKVGGGGRGVGRSGEGRASRRM